MTLYKVAFSYCLDVNGVSRIANASDFLKKDISSIKRIKISNKLYTSSELKLTET